MGFLVNLLFYHDIHSHHVTFQRNSLLGKRSCIEDGKELFEKSSSDPHSTSNSARPHSFVQLYRPSQNSYQYECKFHMEF